MDWGGVDWFLGDVIHYSPHKAKTNNSEKANYHYSDQVSSVAPNERDAVP
jgi:hypothetical protein